MEDVKLHCGAVHLTSFAYRTGESVPPHRHKRGQLIYAASGVMLVTVGTKQWRVPPQRAIWMPAGFEHSMLACGPVELRTVYVPAGLLANDLAVQPRMIAVSALLRELILRGIEIGSSESRNGLRIGVLSLAVEELELLLAESAAAVERALPLPSGEDKRLMRICNAIVADPGHPFGLDDWAREVGASKRTLARRFQSELGLSFVSWRQLARIVAAMARLDHGEPVTLIAGDLGYETPAAFSLMFRKMTGMTPTSYARGGSASAMPLV